VRIKALARRVALAGLAVAAVGTAVLLAVRLEAHRGADDELFEKRSFTDAARNKLPYRLLKPDGYQPTGKDAYPLVVFLHGSLERGNDNEQQIATSVRELAKAEVRKRHPCFVIAPQCSLSSAWSEHKDGLPTLAFTEKPTEAMGLVMGLMDALGKEFRIDPKRIYVTGFSMGGFGTFELLARRPDRIAGAIPICGGGIADRAPTFAKVPVWIFHGTADTIVPPEYSRKMVDALRNAGGHPRYTEYPGVGHNSWTQTYRNPDVLNWLFEQKKD
jgi:predicted peptidase